MFFLLYGKDFKRLLCVDSCKGKSSLVPLKATPAGNPTPLANATIEIPPVITVDLIRTVSTIPVIVLNRFIFLQFVHEPQLRQGNMPQSQKTCVIDMIVLAVQ